ncbi:uncharacterized protein LOC126896520 [Daktulosphaira vitifoliae]|uniref:uncharacterized protein LOC126896520 n=1 Tax=Daktulosphaira vitifoliae TaxID=58002 RepID=UPI0021AAC310|nr:uncharacterized protein LOC126896520 [Daktulosphaira vitifoliae]
MKKPFFFLLLSIFILLTETTLNSRQNTDIYNSLIKNNGWKEIKDVISVKYLSNIFHSFTLLDFVEERDCNKPIRLLTILLGCTYAKELKTLFFLFIKFGHHCQSSITARYTVKNRYNCAMELIKILQKIPSLATLIKNTLYTLDYLHTDPWKDQKKKKFVLDYLLIELENFNNILINYIPLENDTTKIENILNSIYRFFTHRNVEIESFSDLYCIFMQNDIDSQWEEWNEEYKYENKQNEKLQLYDYLSQKINLKMISIIINKFHNLGFQYDRKTKQIGIPLPKQYCIGDLKLFTRNKKTSETIQSESKNKKMKENQFENQWILELID